MAWIEVIEPITGVTLTVQDDSPQAKLWAKQDTKSEDEKSPRSTRAAKSVK